MLNGTIYSVGKNYYEVVGKTGEKIQLRWINSYLIKPKDTIKIPVRIRKEGFQFKQWELAELPILMPKRQLDKMMKHFAVSKTLMVDRKVELRLTINNLVGRLFFGKKHAKNLLNDLVAERISDGEAEGNKKQTRNTSRRN